KQERAAFRTEHWGDNQARGACDKNIARSELRMIVIPQGPFDESLNRAFLRLAADVRRTWGWSTRLLVLVIFAPRARRAAMCVPLLRGVGVSARRSRDHDLLAVIVVRRIVIPVAGPDEPLTSLVLVDLRGDVRV